MKNVVAEKPASKSADLFDSDKPIRMERVKHSGPIFYINTKKNVHQIIKLRALNLTRNACETKMHYGFILEFS